jgi:hypothetical protein
MRFGFKGLTNFCINFLDAVNCEKEPENDIENFQINRYCNSETTWHVGDIKILGN